MWAKDSLRTKPAQLLVGRLSVIWPCVTWRLITLCQMHLTRDQSVAVGPTTSAR